MEGIDNPDTYSLIMPVHLMGYACDMNGINRIAKKYGLLTFEDSAQAHGTTFGGQKTGSLSLMGAFSFYIAHNIQEVYEVSDRFVVLDRGEVVANIDKKDTSLHELDEFLLEYAHGLKDRGES